MLTSVIYLLKKHLKFCATQTVNLSTNVGFVTWNLLLTLTCKYFIKYCIANDITYTTHKTSSVFQAYLLSAFTMSMISPYETADVNVLPIFTLCWLCNSDQKRSQVSLPITWAMQFSNLNDPLYMFFFFTL